MSYRLGLTIALVTISLGCGVFAAQPGQPPNKKAPPKADEGKKRHHHRRKNRVTLLPRRWSSEKGRRSAWKKAHFARQGC